MEEKEFFESIDFKDLFAIRALEAESEKCIITLGEHRASPKVYTNYEEAKEAIENKDWNLIATAIYVQVKYALKVDKEDKK